TRNISGAYVGTDRDLISEGPCPCGKGKIKVTLCSADHPWEGKPWYESKIACSTCARMHIIAESEERSDNRHRLILRKDFAEREGHRKEYLEKCDAILAMPASRKALAKAKDMIDWQGSVAAKFRFLNRHGLANMSESTFRKNFRDSASYIKRLGA